LKNEVKKKMIIDSRQSRHQSHEKKNSDAKCQPKSFRDASIVARRLSIEQRSAIRSAAERESNMLLTLRVWFCPNRAH